jgi:hypothetical protein
MSFGLTVEVSIGTSTPFMYSGNSSTQSLIILGYLCVREGEGWCEGRVSCECNGQGVLGMGDLLEWQV